MCGVQQVLEVACEGGENKNIRCQSGKCKQRQRNFFSCICHLRTEVDSRTMNLVLMDTMVVARLPLAHVCSEQHMLAWQWPVVEADCPKRDKSGKSICRSLWDAMEASGTFLQFFQENLVSLFFTKIFFFSRKENCWDRKVGKTAVCQTFLSHPLRPHPHRTRNASKWDLLMWIGVSTLHASNIKGFAFEFVHASSVDWASTWNLGLARISRNIFR